jgi:hypothetical protein
LGDIGVQCSHLILQIKFLTFLSLLAVQPNRRKQRKKNMNSPNSQQILTNYHSTSGTDSRKTYRRRGQTSLSRSYRTVTSCCSRISRLEAAIDAEEEIAELERKQEKCEIQRKKKLIELKLKLNKAKTTAIDGLGTRQTSR